MYLRKGLHLLVYSYKIIKFILQYFSTYNVYYKINMYYKNKHKVKYIKLFLESEGRENKPGIK